MTLTMVVSTRSAAACMASPRALVNRTPSSNENAPAYHKAVYSPKDNPMATVAVLTAASPSVARSFSTAAADVTKMAGWLTAVESNRSLGPFTDRSSKSYPKIALAFSNKALAAGTSSAT